jgi:protocadherin alpha
MLVALFLMHASFLMLTQPTFAAVSNVFRFDPITVVEEPPIGTLILDLASKLNINDLASFDYKFRFYSPHSLTSHYFLIDQLTGHVKTQRSLDREYLCETKVCGSCHTNTNCTLPVEIVLNSGTRGSSHHEQQKFVSFDVIIEDKNEFAPQFPHAQIQLNASEGAPPNFEIPLEPARDRDSQPVDIVYTLVPNMISNLNDDSSLDIEDTREYQQQLEKLNAQVRLSTPTPTQLSLILLEPFDYEIIKELSFKIVASDRRVKSNADATALSGSCIVTLKIIDINDNLPIFDRTEYEYRLDESQALSDTRLIRVHATDLDDGLNGLVKYSLVDQTFTVNQQLTQTVRVRDLFKIDETNGWISVGDEFSLDYEQMPTYRLTVKAQDSGVSNSMPVYANVIIYLNDVNDNRPQINLTLPSQSAEEEDIYLKNNKIEISEWTMPNSFLAQISVNDGDSGANGKVKLDLKQFKVKTGHHHLAHSQHLLEESNDFSLVHLFNNIYSLMTKHKLDRELYDKYLIDIIATDHGQPTPLQSTFSLEIGIKDENDNAPKFLENVYEFDLMELQSLSFDDEWISVGQVKAVDFDVNDNAQIKYDIELSNQETCKFI